MSAESHPIPNQQQHERRNTQMTATTVNKSKEDIEKTLNENFAQIKGGLEKVFRNQSTMQKTNIKLANFINDRIQQELRVFQIAVPVIIQRNADGDVLDAEIQDFEETRWHKCCALKFKSIGVNGKRIVVVKAELPRRLDSIAYNLVAIHPYTEKNDIYSDLPEDQKKKKITAMTPDQRRAYTDMANGFIRIDNCGLPGNEEVSFHLFDKVDVKSDPRFKNPKTPHIVPIDFKLEFKAFNQK